MRNDFNGMAVNFFMGGNQLSSQLEMTPSENCLEGDMEMTVDQQEVYFAMREVTAKNRARVRRAASNAFQIWPDKTLIYKFNPALSGEMRAIIKDAMREYEENTCIQFKEALDGYTGHVAPLLIKGNQKGCFSSVGKPGGTLNLQEKQCAHFGVVLHELGHALGRFHEQTRPDRGDHVNIIEGNIMSGYAHNFKIAERPTPADYDLQSIMHYSYNAFSKDGRSETIVPFKLHEKDKMGQQKTLSRLDKLTFNLMYDCLENCPEDLASKCQHGGLPFKDCICICPEEYTGEYCETFVKPTDCSEELFGPSGTIRTPQFPQSYPSNTQCTYAIECQEGERVRINFSKFNIEGYGCFFDHLDMKIRGIVDETYPDTFCDYQLDGQSLLSQTNLALMTFTSDDMYNYEGFQLDYKCEQI